MDPATMLALLQLAVASATAIEKLIAEMKAQSGMTDEQLLDWAQKKDADTHAVIQNFLSRQAAPGVSSDQSLSSADATELRALSGTGGLAGAVSGPDGHAD